jgi:uncharacterized protein YceH (UPF0502 family)
VHLFCGDVADADTTPADFAAHAVTKTNTDEDADRLTQLELLVEELRKEVLGLKQRFDDK